MKYVAVLLLASLSVFAQNTPQYNVNLNFLTGGPYGSNSAMDVAFGYQFTTNNEFMGHFITMPGPSYTAFVGGNSYNLCAVSAIENALATTALACGKFSPLVEADAGLARITPSTGQETSGPAVLLSVGLAKDMTTSGNSQLIVKGGWGHFGPDYGGLSGNGFFFYSGLNLGGGTSASATQAKLARIQRSEAKKAARMAKKAKDQQKRLLTN